jgi:hypothetical protein
MAMTDLLRDDFRFSRGRIEGGTISPYPDGPDTEFNLRVAEKIYNSASEMLFDETDYMELDEVGEATCDRARIIELVIYNLSRILMDEVSQKNDYELEMNIQQQQRYSS